MTREWAVDPEAVRSYCQQGLDNRDFQLLAGRSVRYCAEEMARRGKDGYDGWHELSDAERSHWADLAREQFAAGLARVSA